MKFLFEHWTTILAAIILAAYIVTSAWKYIKLIKEKKWQELRAEAYKLMLKFEKAISGTKQGQVKFELVFAEVYNLIPAWLRFWFPETLLREKLQDWYDHIKDYFDNGKIDNYQNLR